MSVLWFVMFLIFAAAEAVTVQLFGIWFAAGALGALAACLIGAPLWLQILLFFALSVLLLVFTRPIVRKMLKGKNTETNLDRIIGHSVIISEKVDNDACCGRCMIDGVSWSVRSIDGRIIEAGEKVTVDHIEGVKLIVK